MSEQKFYSAADRKAGKTKMMMSDYDALLRARRRLVAQACEARTHRNPKERRARILELDCRRETIAGSMSSLKRMLRKLGYEPKK